MIDAPKNTDEMLSFLAGQIAALSSFAQALVLTHPNPEKLLSAHEQLLRYPENAALYTGISDSFLAGLRQVRQGLEIVQSRAADILGPSDTEPQ